MTCSACGMDRTEIGADVCLQTGDAAGDVPRSLQLADVLRAIGGLCDEKNIYRLSLYVGGINAELCWYKRGYGDTPDTMLSQTTWNLAVPLDKQTPEVISFLASVLCK